MGYTDKDRNERDEESAGSQHSSTQEAAEQARRENASTHADAGSAPEQADTGSDDVKPNSERQDPAATYEPDKKRSDL